MYESEKRIQQLEDQIQFLTELFATRDAQSRTLIRHYEVTVAQQSEALAYFRAVGVGQPGEGKVQ